MVHENKDDDDNVHLFQVFIKARDLSDAGIVLTEDNMKAKNTEISNTDSEEQLYDLNHLSDITASSSGKHSAGKSGKEKVFIFWLGAVK